MGRSVSDSRRVEEVVNEILEMESGPIFDSIQTAWLAATKAADETRDEDYVDEDAGVDTLEDNGSLEALDDTFWHYVVEDEVITALSDEYSITSEKAEEVVSLVYESLLSAGW
jgi:hypothetical protein